MLASRRKTEGLLTILPQLFTLFGFAFCNTCQTPDDWLSGDMTIQHAAQGQLSSTCASPGHQGFLWRNGVVKYKLHPSLTLDDTAEVKEAFEEYHQNTCIRFVPWQQGDDDFVSIEVDNTICGFANVCRIGGSQVAKFGGACRNKATMTHQLGHTLCLGHEHQRMDRDLHLNFSSCNTSPRKIESLRRPTKIYDYRSIMHSRCNSCDGGWPWPTDNGMSFWYTVDICRANFATGLSVLDVDNINFLYNCQGCKRHRWVSASSLSYQDYANMPTFGYKTADGKPIHACRAYNRYEVNPGMYNHLSKSCKVPWGTELFEITENVEVLTIPGGLLDEDCTAYKLENYRNAMMTNLVTVGEIFVTRYLSYTAHLVYSDLNGTDGKSHQGIGKAWARGTGATKGFDTAEIIDTSTGVHVSKYQVLTCQIDTSCMLQKIFHDFRNKSK